LVCVGVRSPCAWRRREVPRGRARGGGKKTLGPAVLVTAGPDRPARATATRSPEPLRRRLPPPFSFPLRPALSRSVSHLSRGRARRCGLRRGRLRRVEGLVAICCGGEDLLGGGGGEGEKKKGGAGRQVLSVSFRFCGLSTRKGRERIWRRLRAPRAPDAHARRRDASRRCAPGWGARESLRARRPPRAAANTKPKKRERGGGRPKKQRQRKETGTRRGCGSLTPEVGVATQRLVLYVQGASNCACNWAGQGGGGLSGEAKKTRERRKAFASPETRGGRRDAGTGPLGPT